MLADTRRRAEPSGARGAQLSQQVYEWLRDSILLHRYAPGQRLVVRDLARELGRLPKMADWKEAEEGEGSCLPRRIDVSRQISRPFGNLLSSALRCLAGFSNSLSYELQTAGSKR